MVYRSACNRTSTDTETINRFFGIDFDHIHRLNGEVELWVEGKQHKTNKSFAAIIPEGVEHGPLTVRNVSRPIFRYSAGHAGLYM